MKILKGSLPKVGGRRLTTKEAQAVAARCETVRRQGDRALARGRKASPLVVERRAFRQAFGRLTPQARAALELACRHFGALARRELAALKEFDLKPTPGMTLYQRLLPVASVGILVPSGRVSALLAGAIPAAVAGVTRRVVCTEGTEDGVVDPHVLAAAYMCDVTELHAVGGVDGLAALAHGTRTIGAVERIVGQGDERVCSARAGLLEVCGEALITGPGSLLVLADETAAPEFVAVDLLAQAVSDPEGRCVLMTPTEGLAEAVQDELRKRQRPLPAKHPARGALRRAQAVVVKSLGEAVGLANELAPHRLSLLVKRPDVLVGRLQSYGTLLVGPHTPAALADRVTGVGGLLPGRVQQQAAVAVSTFLRRVTVQQADPSAYLRLGRAATTLAELEGQDEAAAAIQERILPSELDPQD